MNLQDYLNRRREREAQSAQFRKLCLTCRQPSFSCYCEHIKPFDSKIKFVILIHPIEVRRRIATGRMAHLCLENSEIIRGLDYTNDYRVNEILNNPQNECVVLYPGRNSINLTAPESVDSPKLNQNSAPAIKHQVFSPDKTPVVFVIDGTWATSRKMIRLSKNINTLKRICFTPITPSNFRVRKQPKPNCLSTIEAIFFTINLLADQVGFDLESGLQSNLTTVFDKMVERQIEFIKQSRQNLRSRSYRSGRTPHIEI